jgi:biotin carboxyl carrier protein
MKHDDARAAADWMKGTDLVEVAYRKDGEGFALAAAGAADGPALAAAPLPAPRYAPAVSEGVGVLQWSEPGKARAVDEGTTVAEGQVVAVVVPGSGAPRPVKAPVAGRVAKVLAEAGQAVEYGSPVLLIETRG